jgi:hypothetical protein
MKYNITKRKINETQEEIDQLNILAKNAIRDLLKNKMKPSKFKSGTVKDFIVHTSRIMLEFKLNKMLDTKISLRDMNKVNEMVKDLTELQNGDITVNGDTDALEWKYESTGEKKHTKKSKIKDQKAYLTLNCKEGTVNYIQRTDYRPHEKSTQRYIKILTTKDAKSGKPTDDIINTISDKLKKEFTEKEIRAKYARIIDNKKLKTDWGYIKRDKQTKSLKDKYDLAFKTVLDYFVRKYQNDKLNLDTMIVKESITISINDDIKRIIKEEIVKISVNTKVKR